MRTRTALIALGLLASAQVAHAEIKIIVVRSADVVRESPQFKAAETKMKAEFEKRKNDLEAQAKAFSDDLKTYQRDGDTMTPDQRAKKEKDLNARQVDIQFAQRKFQEDLANRDRELTQDMMNKIKDVITQVAKEKNADLVLQDPIYSSPAVDVTADVLKRLGGK